MKIGYIFLAALFSSLIFCNSLVALADSSLSARDDQTGECLRRGDCKD